MNEIETNKVYELEREIMKMPQVDCPIREFFADGLYIREMTIPAGTVATGALHKKGHANIITKGHFIVHTKDGAFEYEAPQTIISTDNTKKAVYAITETVWSSIHATDKTDTAEIVKELTDSTLEQLIGGKENLQLQKEKERWHLAFQQEHG